MPYLLPPDADALDGACAADDRLCVWSGRAAFLWAPEAEWTALAPAPTSIDSGFELKSGVLAGADTHVGFLPSDGAEWAWWADLSAFTDAHPMFGDLLLCTDRDTATYALFAISASGLEEISRFGAEELAEPVAGWSPPTNADRLLLLGDGGLWALDPPYAADALQHLVSFKEVDLPAFEDLAGRFQPGFATVVIPRRHRTALRLDLSDGTGHATGLKHLPGGGALWRAYLQDDRTAAARILEALTALPPAPSGTALRLHDVLMDGRTVRALATSAGLWRPPTDETTTSSPASGAAERLADAPLEGPALATWALWLGWDGAQTAACRALCNTPDPDLAGVESLRRFAGTEACETLFDLLRSDAAPTGPSTEDEYQYSRGALRALVACFGTEVAPLVRTALDASAPPARAAASTAAGALRTDHPDASDADDDSALWNEDHPVPTDVLRQNAHHDHPAVRAAARDTCARLSIAIEEESPEASGGAEPPADEASEPEAPSYPRRSVQSSQPESPK
jgi:hypothetical protein